MANTKKATPKVKIAPANGRDGIDRWTTNGVGVKLVGKQTTKKK